MNVSDHFQSSGNPPSSERRFHWRQIVLFSCAELSEDNGDIVLNISQGVLALRAVAELIDDELLKMRFQFSRSYTWIETEGRITWSSARRWTGYLHKSVS
jgi:hypothetical protein